MAFQKYQKAEQLDLFTDAKNQVVNNALRKAGKTSYAQLTDAERQQVTDKINDLNIPE